MTTEPNKGYPAPTIRRLPMYLRYLRRLHKSGRDVVSCTHIARDLDLVSVQVRKDLAVTGIVGRPKVGYEVPALIDAIETFLGWKNSTDAFLVGAGSLGSAILGYEGFSEDGLNIVAAFDTNPQKAGTTIHGTKVFPLDKMQELAERMHAKIGILTVPGPVAQSVADMLVTVGVKAIWNYTPVHLDLPDGVIREDVRLASSWALLSRRLKALLNEENGISNDDGDHVDGDDVTDDDMADNETDVLDNDDDTEASRLSHVK